MISMVLEVLAFDGLFGLFCPWMIFLSKGQSLMINIKQNWEVSNNQMSKRIYESKSLIYGIVMYVDLEAWF